MKFNSSKFYVCAFGHTLTGLSIPLKCEKLVQIQAPHHTMTCLQVTIRHHAPHRHQRSRRSAAAKCCPHLRTLRISTPSRLWTARFHSGTRLDSGDQEIPSRVGTFSPEPSPSRPLDVQDGAPTSTCNDVSHPHSPRCLTAQHKRARNSFHQMNHRFCVPKIPKVSSAIVGRLKNW